MMHTAQKTPNQDLQPFVSFSKSIRSNATYVNITTVRLYPDGTVTQSMQIINKTECDVMKFK